MEAHQKAAVTEPLKMEGEPTRTHTRESTAYAGWDPLLACTALVIAFAVARLHLVFPVLGVLQLLLITGIGATALYLLDVHPARRLGALRSPAMMWLLGFTIWMALTVPSALREARSAGFLFDNFIKTVIIFGLIAGAVRNWKDVERLALVYFIGAAVYALAVIVRFEVGPGSWRLEELYTYDPNDFATFAVTALPIGFYALTHSSSRLRRYCVLIGCVAIGVAFVWAGSRGGFLACLGTLAFLLIRYRAVSVRWRAIGTGVIALVVLAVASDRYWSQMATMLEPAEDYNVTAETGRLHVWRRGIGYMVDRPIFGVGPANFPVAEGVLSPLAERQKYGIGVPWTAPHNSFVQVGAELGLPGLILFLALIASAFRSLRRVEKRGNARPGRAPPSAAALAQALAASMIGFLIGAFFLSLAYAPMLYTLIALAVALRKVVFARDRVRSLRSARAT